MGSTTRGTIAGVFALALVGILSGLLLRAWPSLLAFLFLLLALVVVAVACAQRVAKDADTRFQGAALAVGVTLLGGALALGFEILVTALDFGGRAFAGDLQLGSLVIHAPTLPDGADPLVLYVAAGVALALGIAVALWTTPEGQFEAP